MSRLKIDKAGILTCCAVLMILTACKKFTEIDGPKNQLTSGLVFADSTNADAAILGIYAQIASTGNFSLLNGGMTLYPGLSADELNTTFTDASLAAFANNNILVANDRNQSLYLIGYRYIYSTNAGIEGIEASNRLSPSNKQHLTGELRCIRAWIYFNLVNIYGDLPIVTTADYNKSRLIGRSPVNLVYDQIIADLKFAQDNLDKTSAVKERAGYYAATGLLAKAYLYTGKYDLALAEANKVINSGQYALENLGSVFLSGSTETIWNILSIVPNQATYEGLYFIPGSASVTPRYVITSSLFNSFETGDNRKTAWIRTNTISGRTYPYPYKYKVRNTSATPAEKYVIMRLSELFLIRAEAKAFLGDTDGAKNDLNKTRNRAGLGNLSISGLSDVKQAIENERRAELFCEWGNRWMDLKRTGRAVNVLSPGKPNLTLHSTLFPIPLNELNANPNLSQNPGY